MQLSSKNIAELKRIAHSDKNLLKFNIGKENIENTIESLRLVIDSINNDMPEDFYSIDLKNAYMHLGFITGQEIDDDVSV